MADLAGKIVLLVEDDALIAALFEDMFLDAGATIIGPILTCEDALLAIANYRPDVASLDWSLLDGTSQPVAEALAAMGVPFLFITGNPVEDVQEHFPGSLVLEKPIFDFDGLIRQVVGIIPPRSPP